MLKKIKQKIEKLIKKIKSFFQKKGTSDGIKRSNKKVDAHIFGKGKKPKKETKKKT